MIINLIIKLQNPNKDKESKYQADIKTAITASHSTERTICPCGKIYPKVIRLTETDFLVPIEGRYQAEIDLTAEGESIKDLTRNIAVVISHELNIPIESVEHGANDIASRPDEPGSCPRASREEGVEPIEGQ